MTGVFDVSPIAEEAICLAMMVMVITGAQFCGSIMITETPVELLLNAIQLILSRKSSPSPPNKKRLSVMVKSKNALNIKIFFTCSIIESDIHYDELLYASRHHS